MTSLLRILPILTLLVGAVGCDTVPAEDGAETVIYRTSLAEEASGATALPNGDLIVVGSGEGVGRPADGTNAYPLLLRIRADGVVADTAIYHDVGYGYASSAVHWEGGMAVLVKPSALDRPEGEEAVLTLYRTAFDGTRIDTLRAVPDGYPAGSGLLRTADGGLLLTVASIGDGPHLVKIAPRGDVAWTYRVPDVQLLVDVAETASGGLVVLGIVHAKHYTLTGLTAGGEPAWQRAFGADAEPLYQEGDTLRRPVALETVGEGGAVLLNLNPPGRGAESVLLSRVDERGELLWERAYASGDVAAGALTALPGGGFLLSYARRYSDEVFGATRSFVLGVSENGEKRWRKPFGPWRGTTYVRAIELLADGRLAAVGFTGPERLSGYGGDDFDVLVGFYDPQ